MKLFDSLSLFIMSMAMFGCNVSQLAPGPIGGTKLEGTNAAIGGVNLHNKTSSSSKSWDRHIDSCRLDEAKQELVFAAGGTETLRVALDQQQKRATVVGPPDGTVIFAAQECSVYKLEAAPSQSGSYDGKVSLVCSRGEQELSSSVRFERCRH